MNNRSLTLACILMLMSLMQTRAGAQTEDANAETVLEAKGLVKGTFGFTVKSEVEALAKLIVLKNRMAEFEQAYLELQNIRVVLSRLSEIDEAITIIDARIAGIRFQIDQYPATYRGGRWVRGTSIQENQFCEALEADRRLLAAQRDTTLIPERDRLRRLQPGQKLGPADERFRLTSGALTAAMNESRDALTATKRSYDDAQADAQAKQALARLGSKLSSSPEYQSAAGWFAHLEMKYGGEFTSGLLKPNRQVLDGNSLKPSAPVVDTSVRSAGLVKLAMQTERTGKTKGALQLYKDALKLDPANKIARDGIERLSKTLMR